MKKIRTSTKDPGASQQRLSGPMCHDSAHKLLSEIFHRIMPYVDASFGGLGLVIYEKYAGLPVTPMKQPPPDLPLSSPARIADALRAYAAVGNSLHDGFHLISSDGALTHAAQYFSPPIVSSVGLGVDMRYGGRRCAALFGSCLPGVLATGVLSRKYGPLIFINGKVCELSSGPGRGKPPRDESETFNAHVAYEPVHMTLVSRRADADGRAIKWLFRAGQNKLVEAVSIVSGMRHAVCISSQVGCAMGCVFCATGLDGLQANLTSEEIFEQVVFADKLTAQPVTNVVFMGMGEPFCNRNHVFAAADRIHKWPGLRLPAHKITISTVGVVPGILELARRTPAFDLAISLHAANDAHRESLVPAARRYPLRSILKAVDEYIERVARPVAFEYTLIRGVNDSNANAIQLAKLLSGPLRFVTLIPYNHVEPLPYRRPTERRIAAFLSLLVDHGIETRIRNSKGAAIGGACGQLRNLHGVSPSTLSGGEPAKRCT